LLSFSLSQRIPEIGLRIALGARSNDILKTVLNKGFQVAIFGVALGVILAFLAAQAMQSLLAGIQPWDVVTFFSASVVALLMTISGCLFPALRAIRVDPAIVMREA
jgi:ABC-type antimicrobial peptide transport system permease subunit